MRRGVRVERSWGRGSAGRCTRCVDSGGEVVTNSDTVQSTPLRRRITCAEMAQMKSGGDSAGPGAGDALRGGANSRHRHPSFLGLEIIGRSTNGVRLAVRRRGSSSLLSHPVAVFHQPSRQQGGRSLLQPDIEEFDDFLADVGCIGSIATIRNSGATTRDAESKNSHGGSVLA